MALDIRQGDILVKDSREYPIRFLASWKHRPGSTASFLRVCTETYGTKRNPAISGGARGEPTANLSNVKGTPLDMAQEGEKNVHVRELVQSPYNLLTCLLDGGDTFYEIYVEDIKKA